MADALASGHTRKEIASAMGVYEGGSGAVDGFVVWRAREMDDEQLRDLLSYALQDREFDALGLEWLDDARPRHPWARRTRSSKREAQVPENKLDQLEQAIAGASPEQIAAAVPGYLDGDDIEKLIHLLKAQMYQPA